MLLSSGGLSQYEREERTADLSAFQKIMALASPAVL